MNKKILAIIPARGGSTGLPNKNILDFCGKPMIYYTIAEAQKSSVCDRIVVSTDSEAIAAVSRECGAEVPYLRPPELATADANIVDTVLHMLDYLRDEDGYEPDMFFLLQPTSPLREASDITQSLGLFEKERSSVLISVCPTLFQVFYIQEGKLAYTQPQDELINRQERAATYKQDGSMIYLYDTNYFRQNPNFAPEGATAYVVPKWKAVDVDDKEDFELAEVLYKNRDSFKQS